MVLDTRQDAGSPGRTRLLGPRALALFLIAAGLLLVIHFAAVYLVFSPPFSAVEWTLLLATEAGGIALFAFAGFAASRSLASYREMTRVLDETQSRLEAIIDASPLAIVAGDRDGNVVLWNDAAEEMFGWSAGEVLERAYPAVPEDGREAWLNLRRRVLGGEIVTDIQTHRRTRDGRALAVSVSAAPIRDPEGEIQGTIAVIADVTQRRVAERERERLETQLRQSQKLEAVGRLAGGVAHDFNNLLTAIKGHAELALSAADAPASVREDVAEIARSADRAAALTRQLLAFSRQSITEPRSLDLNELVEGMGSLVDRLVGETVRVETRLSASPCTVLADPGQLEQVLMNLVVNARDALGGGGTITIRTRDAEITPSEAGSYPYNVRPGGYRLLEVTDTGSGMDEQTARQVFEPFFTTKPLGVGTGLGLSTVYGIVKQARGYIWVESTLGEGTTFRIYLPRHEAEPDPDSTPVSRAAAAEGGSGTILVVEDEPAVLLLARRTLERHGYRVLTAQSGVEATRLAHEHDGDIDLLFCDVVMPDLTGRDVVDRINGLRSGIRVLMTSGYAEHQIAHDGVLDEGIEFLAKPYTPHELADRVREILRQDE